MKTQTQKFDELYNKPTMGKTTGGTRILGTLMKADYPDRVKFVKGSLADQVGTVMEFEEIEIKKQHIAEISLF